MYERHFGLAKAPFRITPDPEFFFSGGNRGAVLEALIYATARGEGIVTRRPLELRLVHDKDCERTMAVFEKNPKEVLTDFNLVRQRIIEYTDKDAGVRKGISSAPLRH